MDEKTDGMDDLYDLSDLEMLALDCLTRAGVSDSEARIISRDIALSQAAGVTESGFEALLRDIRLVRYGRVHLDAQPRVSPVAGAVLHVDAGHGFAAPAIARALPRLIETAMGEGLALLHLTNATDPGAMANAMTELAEAGLAGVSLRPLGQAYAVRPGAASFATFETRAETMLSSLLSMAPPPADSPLDDPVAHSGWIAALDPEVTAAEELLASLPISAASPTRAGIAIRPELLAQIVNA